MAKEKEKSPHIDSEFTFNPIIFIKDRVSETIYSFKTFKSDYTDSLCLIFSNLAIAASFIGLIVLEIIFVAGGNYARAYEGMTENGISAAFAAVEGNVYMMYSGIPGIIAEVLLILYALALIVHFYRHTGIVRRIFMSVVLALETVTVLFVVLFPPYAQKVFNEIPVDTAQYKFVSNIYKATVMTEKVSLIIMILVMIFPVIFAVMLLTYSWSRQLFLHGLPAIILVFAGFPLLLFIIENIIVVAVFILIAAVIRIIAFFFGYGSSSDNDPLQDGTLTIHDSDGNEVSMENISFIERKGK